jgi:hypothetical protein
MFTMPIRLSSHLRALSASLSAIAIDSGIGWRERMASCAMRFALLLRLTKPHVEVIKGLACAIGLDDHIRKNLSEHVSACAPRRGVPREHDLVTLPLRWIYMATSRHVSTNLSEPLDQVRGRISNIDAHDASSASADMNRAFSIDDASQICSLYSIKAANRISRSRDAMARYQWERMACVMPPISARVRANRRRSAAAALTNASRHIRRRGAVAPFSLAAMVTAQIHGDTVAMAARWHVDRPLASTSA